MSTSDEVPVLPFSMLRHYQIRERIGRSRQGDLYRAYEPPLDRMVEIETLDQSLAADESVVWRFYLQASAAAKLAHPNLQQVYFVGTDRGRYFQAREYVEGETLAHRLSRTPPLAPDDAPRIARQILSGLAALERHGRIAADLDPAHVALDSRHGRVVLTRLEAIEASRGTAPASAGPAAAPAGQAPPRAPESQCQHDLHAVGVLLYRMLADRPDYDPAAPLPATRSQLEQQAPVLATLPGLLVEVLSKLLGLSPESAPFPSVQSVLDELQPLFSDRKSAESPATAAPVEQFPVAPGTAPTAGQEQAVSMIVEMPPLDVLPELPPALRMRPPVQRRGVLSRLGGWFVRQRPEPIERLLGTQFACDTALAECRRRHEVLSELEREAEAVLHTLQEQVAAAPAGQPGTALIAAISEQQAQLTAIRDKLATLSATLQRLQFERDALQARLNMAEARSQPGGRGRQPARRAATRIAMAMGLFALAGYLMWDNFGEQLQRNYTQLKTQVKSRRAINVSAQYVNLKWLPASRVAVPFRRLHGHGRGINGLAFIPGRRLLVSSSYDETIRFWIPETGEEIRRFVPSELNPGRPLYGMALSPDGRTIAAVGPANGLILFDAATGNPIRTVQGQLGLAVYASFSPDGKTLAVVHSGSDLQLFDVATGLPSQKIDAGKKPLVVTPFSPSESCLAVVAPDSPLTFWNTSTRALLWRGGADEGVHSVAFAATGDRLATGHADGSITIRNAKNGELLAKLPYSGGGIPVGIKSVEWEWVNALAFSPDGSRLAAASLYVTRIWNLAERAIESYCVGRFEHLAFSSDGEYLATGCSANSARGGQPALVLWRLRDKPQSESEQTGKEALRLNPESRDRTLALAAHLKDAYYFPAIGEWDHPDFIRNVRLAAQLLPLAEVAVGTAPARWQEVRMNVHGRGIDCIRFVSPLDEPADLHWAFTGNVMNSRVDPMRGAVPAPGPVCLEYNVDLPPLQLPPGVPVVFRAELGTIQPRGEYLIWFFWETTEPFPFQIALHLRKAQPRASKSKPVADEFAAAMGWPVPIPRTGDYGTPWDLPQKIRLQSVDLRIKPPFLEDSRSGNRIRNSGIR